MSVLNDAAHSRRRILSLGTAAGLGAWIGTTNPASAERNNVAEFYIDVRKHGARGDASTDDTSAFQRALDETHHYGGGTVYAPPGRYLFRGTLMMPDGV